MELDEFATLSDSAAVDQIAILIDQASDTRDGSLTDHALSLSEQLAARITLSGEQRVLLHYFRANAFENKLREAGQGQT